MSLRPVRCRLHAVCLVLLVYTWHAGPARAARPEPTRAVVSVLLAADDGWGVRKLLGGMNTRARIIQIAIACMALGLFILMRKLQ